MQIRVLASTKAGYEMPKEEAVNFSGKSAGICYLPDSLDTLFSEDPAKTERRAKGTLASGHHSVFGHVTYNLALEGIPKILAMILNNEKIYNTSEKSARYTKMEPSEKEKVLYEKWSLVAVDRQQGGHKALQQVHVESFALISLDNSLFDKAFELNIINKAQLDTLYKFKENPDETMKSFLIKHPEFIKNSLCAGGKSAKRAQLCLDNNIYGLKSSIG